MRACLLTSVLADPGCLKGLSPADWDALIRSARRADLLGRLAELALARLPEQQIPRSVLGHLRAEQVLLTAQRASVLREIAFVERALVGLETPLVLLKGAAYLLAGLPAAAGRTFSDIDLLVPRAALPQVESALMAGGWQTTHLDAYDQRYYREWMHELPPMQHVRRRSVLDVHHNLMPLTARLHPDADALLAAAQPVPGHARWRVLAPADMVLHSMTHLLHNEEFSHGLRDLSDLDALLRHFGALPGFWDDLLARAELHQLTRPLYYGLRQVAAVFATPVPVAVSTAMARHAPPAILLPLMDALWQRVLRSPHPMANDATAACARQALYIRAHWLKMPLWRLMPHLARKALWHPQEAPEKRAP